MAFKKNNNDEVDEPIIIENWSDFKDIEDDEAIEYDFEQDAFSSIRPPKPGRYKLQLDFAADNPQVKVSKQGKSYFSARLECEIVGGGDEDALGAKVYPTITSIIGRGKKISPMLGLMIKAGKKLSSTKMTSKQVAQEFYKWIESKPTIDAEIEWQLGYMKPERNGVKWTTKYSRYSQFPIDETTGEKQFQFEFNVNGEVITANAMLRVIAWYGKGEKDKVKKGSTILKSRNVVNKDGKSAEEELKELEMEFEEENA